MGSGGYSRAVVGRGMSAKSRHSQIFAYATDVDMLVIIILKYANDVVLLMLKFIGLPSQNACVRFD